MRTLVIISTMAILFSSCSTSFKAGVAEYDDLYYTPKKAVVSESPAARDTQVVKEATEAPAESGQVATAQEREMSEYEKYRMGLESEYLSGDSEEGSGLKSEALFDTTDTTYYDESGDYGYTYYDDGETPIINNNYYGDVYQDNYPSYSSRINRFHSPYLGFNYYDPWFNGFYDPYYYDSWYSPGFSLSFNMGWGLGFGWGYPGYYGYGWPYYSAYNPFYYRSYYYGYNPYRFYGSPYYGYYDYYSPYRYAYYNETSGGTRYGHRTSSSGYSNRTSSGAVGRTGATSRPDAGVRTAGNQPRTATRTTNPNADRVAAASAETVS